MPAEMLTAFLAFVNPMSLPRRHRNNGNAIVAVDLAERPDDHQAVAATLKARIEMLEADIAKLEATAAVHRADFERERERCERLMAEVLKTTAELMAAREATARIAGELAGLPSETVVAPLVHKLLAGIEWRRSGCAARLAALR